MLVLSRRETETIDFPALETTIEFMKIRGNVVRVGIKAPDQLRIVRGELTQEDGPSREEDNLFAQNEALRYELNRFTEGLQRIQRYLELGQDEEVRDTVWQLLQTVPETKARAVRPASTVLVAEEVESHLAKPPPGGGLFESIA